jgi:hypothetical protein
MTYVGKVGKLVEISSSHGGEYEVQNCLVRAASIIRDDHP